MGGRRVEKRVELTLLMDFYGPLLTEHRREVLSLYCDEDLSFQEIADQLGISRTVAKEHVENLLVKLGAANRTEAVAIALRKQLVKI